MVYKQIKINITKKQLDQALKGKPVRFSANQIGSGDSYLSLHPANVKIVEKSAMKGSGCCLNLTEGELLATAEDSQGRGIFGDIFKGLKSGYKWAKKNIIDTPIYQKALKPLVRGAVETAKTAAKAYAPALAPAIDMATEKIGSETGAFGVRRSTKAKKYEALKAKGLYLS
jgi:hypothetical protein